jgi:hypothetical protein
MRGILFYAVSIWMTATLALGQTASAVPQTYVLDFVTAPAETDTPADRARQREAGVGGLGIHFATDSERLPLELTLVQLDRSGYTVADRVFYEVALKHVGTRPLPFPIAQTTRPFSRTHPIARQVMILLHINDEVLGDQLIGQGTTAYSGDSLTETFVMLKPGDTVRIRGVGNWFLMENQLPPLLTNWTRNVTVKALLQYYGGDLNPIEESNGMSIQLQSRRNH